mmetsp:Transcript_13487/g.25230  ORF Transcript_13487/g.25230 Transcript_13487/m.25230 type:complete len:231 (+) Transcript_13487:585-1277(+)
MSPWLERTLQLSALKLMQPSHETPLLPRIPNRPRHGVRWHHKLSSRPPAPRATSAGFVANTEPLPRLPSHALRHLQLLIEHVLQLSWPPPEHFATSLPPLAKASLCRPGEAPTPPGPAPQPVADQPALPARRPGQQPPPLRQRGLHGYVLRLSLPRGARYVIWHCTHSDPSTAAASHGNQRSAHVLALSAPHRHQMAAFLLLEMLQRVPGQAPKRMHQPAMQQLQQQALQ